MMQAILTVASVTVYGLLAMWTGYAVGYMRGYVDGRAPHLAG